MFYDAVIGGFTFCNKIKITIEGLFFKDRETKKIFLVSKITHRRSNHDACTDSTVYTLRMNEYITETAGL